MRNTFPYLTEDEYFAFPAADNASPEGIVAIGGNLSPGMLISAYQQGIFPWYSRGEPILWWNPDPRFVLYPAQLQVSQSMHKLLKQGRFSFSLDSSFSEVIRHCQTIPRKGQPGTWITKEMLKAYITLHELGYAHSVEVWENEELAGGLYGISLGNYFCGESMFSLKPNTSKAALIVLSWFLADAGFAFIDCQVHTAHLASLGAVHISRAEYLRQLAAALQQKTHKGNWSSIFPRFPYSTRYTTNSAGTP